MKKLLILSAVVIAFAFATTAMAATDTIVSDTSVFVYGPIDHYAATTSGDWGTTPISSLATWVHPSWPTISGATWISSAYSVENARVDSWRMFSDDIEIPSCASNIVGTMTSITSDNAEEVYLNGTLVGSDGEVQGTSIDNQEWNTVLSYPLTGLQTGTNSLKTIVRNYAYDTDNPQVNPTGLIYKIDLSYDLLTFYQDLDGDGYGNPQITTQACSAPQWYVADNTDCDDTDADKNPGETEICNGKDDNCNGQIDEGLTAPFASKQQGVCAGSLQVCAGVSGWAEPDYTSVFGYESTETSCDTKDNDCNGTVDLHVCNWYCAPTANDKVTMPKVSLGTNRWIYDPSKSLTTFGTILPNGKGWLKGYELAQTNNCSCSQILKKLNEYNPAMYGNMGGHWKYGCSISVMNEFIGLIKPITMSGKWSLSVNGGAYMHDMFIVTMNSNGSFTGNGGYPAGSGPIYPSPYNWTLAGQLTGNAITMTITYQNSYTATISGTVGLLWNSMSGGAGTGGVTSWSATKL